MLHIIHLPDRTDRWTLLLSELERQGISDYRIWPGVEAVRPSSGIANGFIDKRLLRALR